MTDPKKITQKVLKLLTFDQVKLNIQETDETINIQIKLPQEESGILIGHRGEKINALQLILSLMINRGSITYKPVFIDINQYRDRHNQALHELADKATQKAVESGREILLPPLSGSERRIIHLHLSQNSAVNTYSEGEGTNRRLVIRPTEDDKK